MLTGSVKAVANEFLDLGEADRVPIDPLQIQKFGYLAQGWALGLSGFPLFREHIEAWEYGPVSPDLYRSLSAFGGSPIRGRLKVYDRALGRVINARCDFDSLGADIIARVWKKYGGWSGPRLVALTHLRGAPWDLTRRAYPGENDARISREMMRDWFEEEAAKASPNNE